MSAPTELLDLHAITPHPPGVDHIDGFESMGAVVLYLTQHPDQERSYAVTDVAGNIRAVALFNGDSLLLLSSGGEVVREREGGGRAHGDQPELGLQDHQRGEATVLPDRRAGEARQDHRHRG